MTYPVPSDFLEAARDDLIMKIERNETRYLNKSNYWNGIIVLRITIDKIRTIYKNKYNPINI